MAEMELYSLGDDFLPRKLIEPYISAIWTERYSSAGDMEVVVQAPSILADELSRGRYVGMRGSKEIMRVETRTIENGLLTAKGPSLLKFFDEREAWFENPDFKTGGTLPVPSPTMVSRWDFSGSLPLHVIIPTPAGEVFDGRTIVYVLMGVQGRADISHPKPVTGVPVYPVGEFGQLNVENQAWRLKQASDLTFILSPSNAPGTTGVARVYVLRGVKPPNSSGYVHNSFFAGYGSTSQLTIAGTSSGSWPAGHRWIAWAPYQRTVLSGNTLPAGGPITGPSWTDDGEIDAPTDTDGVSIRLRSAHDFTGSAANTRPAATFNLSIEWAQDPLTDLDVLIFDLDTDDPQPIPPENSDTPLFADYTVDRMQIGEFLSTVVSAMLINPGGFGDPYTSINLDWADDGIPGLELGAIDWNGEYKRLTFPVGSIYEGMSKLATDQHIGIKLYLESASPSGFVLKFASYRGVDRTSVLDVTRLIRMSPDMDSLLNSKEFTSSEGYKNLVYVTYKNRVSMHYLGTTEPLGFNRRVIRVDADKTVDADKVAAYRTEVAWNTMLAHQLASAVDGQVHTVSLHKFGKDYYLGDMIEIQGNDGLISIAQVTEHIRSQDETGFKEYPTLSVIDPVLFDFNNDLGGDVGSQDWHGDPTYTIDG